MKKILVTLCLCMALFCSVTEAKANSGSGFYISPRFALALHDQSRIQVGYNPVLDGQGIGFGISGGLAIGYDKQYSTSYMPVRIEAEALFRTNSKYEGSHSSGATQYQQDIGISTYFLNAYYDFHSAGSFVPYITAGIGYARIKNKFTQANTFYEDVSNQLAYNAGLGLSWLVQAGFGLDIGYRFTSAGESKKTFAKNYVSNTEPVMHEVMMGVRLTF